MTTENTAPITEGEVLVVEDNVSNLKYLSDILKEAGYLVRAASDGELALRSIEAKIPDLVLLDIQMPGMDGIEACKRLKKKPALSELPIIFLSAQDDTVLKVKALEAGGADYVTKPFQPYEIIARIKTHMTISRSITIQKQLNAQLRESEQRFHDLFEKAPLGYQSLDSDGNFIEVNHAWLETLGYKREEVLGRWFGDFLAPEYVQAFRERFPLFKAQGHIHSEFFMLHKDGSRRYISFDGRIGHNDDGSFKQTHCILKDETDRKRMEESLRESDALHSKMISNIGDVIVIIDQNGVNRYKSPNIEKYFGWKPEDVVGRNTFDNVHPDDLARGQAFIGELALTPGASGTTEVRYRCKDGSYKWIEVTIVNLLTDSLINGFLGNYKDITERKHFEVALRKSEENYRLQFLNMNSYNSMYEVVTDKVGKPCDFRFIMVNHAYEKYVGKMATELIGKTLLEVFPQTEKYWIDKMAEVALTEVPCHFESFSNVMDTYTEIYLYVPKKGHLAMTTANIDGRKKTEMALRASEERYRNLFDKSRDALMTLEPPSWSFTSGNPATVEMFRAKSEEDFILYDPWALSPIKQPDGSVSAEKAGVMIETAMQEGSHFFDWTHKRINGEEFPATVLLTKVHTSGIDILQATVRDITDQKRAEEEHLKYENQHQQNQKLESLGVLAGGIAHDFNNIMSMIFGYVEMAVRKSKEEQIIGSLKKCLGAMDRARDLTGQLMTFARGGEPKLNIEPLFPFVQESVQFALSGSNVSCSFNISRELQMCNYDRNQIGQVVDNIIINAKQAMPMGGTIELSAMNVVLSDKEHMTLPKGNYIKISIKDSGTGISKEMLPRIFDPFFTTKTTGHGLGLATCYSIINRHGGCIDVESELGKGSTFHIYLPASESGINPTKTNLTAFGKRSGTFLVMDDEECILEVNKDMLESLGYTFVGKADVKSAIAFVAEEVKANRSIAGIILDLTIPGGIGGKEAVKEIRKLCPETPIFVASGYSKDPAVARPKEHGFTASISKPFNIDELSEMLGKHLTNKA